MADHQGEGLRLGFNSSLRLEFHGAKVTSDAGLLAYRELDEALGLFDRVSALFHDSRTRRNIQHDLPALLRQSVYSRLAGYEDVNDAHRLSVDPTMRRITGKKDEDKKAANTNTMGRFETRMLSVKDNLEALSEVNGQWVERALERTSHRRIILDLDSSASPVHGQQEASADALANIRYFASTSSEIAKLPCFGPATCTARIAGRSCWNRSWVATRRKRCANTFGGMLLSPSRKFMNIWRRAFCMPSGFPANEVLQAEIEPLLRRPVGRPPRKPIVWFADLKYQAATWDRPRRVIAKVEWHQGELYPRVGFIVTNMSAQALGVVRFYNGRGTAEQWIKEGKYALNWTRLSCQRFVPNQVRLALFVLAYNLGNFLRRLVLPRSIKHWSFRTLLAKLIKIGAKVVRHSRMETFQMAEVAVSKEIWAELLSRIDPLRWMTA